MEMCQISAAEKDDDVKATLAKKKLGSNVIQWLV